MFLDMAAKYRIPVHGRKVKESSLSFVLPNNGKRAIIRCRDDHYLHPFPVLNTTGLRALHLDGHQAEAAIHYAKACRDAGVLTSLDGGGVRENTHDLLGFIDVAICAERMAEQMDLTPERLLDYLKSRGCRIGGVTMGERGMLWYDEAGVVQRQKPLAVPSSLVIDSSGAGDVFHGAYVFSSMHRPGLTWREHFQFARAASAFKIQHLGNENGLPSLGDIDRINAEFKEAA
jgi:sugar/nucleoside kinase (ribokinase family)